MLYLLESTNPNSVFPLSNSSLLLCSSIGWKEAAWVLVPSLRGSRQGCVTPLLDDLRRLKKIFDLLPG